MRPSRSTTTAAGVVALQPATALARAFVVVDLRDQLLLIAWTSRRSRRSVTGPQHPGRRRPRLDRPDDRAVSLLPGVGEAEPHALDIGDVVFGERPCRSPSCRRAAPSPAPRWPRCSRRLTGRRSGACRTGSASCSWPPRTPSTAIDPIAGLQSRRWAPPFDVDLADDRLVGRLDGAEGEKEQQHEGDQQVHRRPGPDHDDPLPDRLVVVAARGATSGSAAPPPGSCR